jgi:hypothetical protein
LAIHRKKPRRDLDVGVVVLVVGVGVVAGVLVHPGRVAEADHAAVPEADDVVGPAVAEDLLVPGVVPDEGQLREHHGEEHRQEQLPPRVAQVDERHPAAREREDVEARRSRCRHWWRAGS